jgi:hypothetical protein
MACVCVCQVTPNAPQVLTSPLTFFGWDVRLGSGFANASTAEAAYDYRFLVLRTWAEWSAALRALGQAGAADHYAGYGAAGEAYMRALLGSPWYAGLGVHAAAEALNVPGFASDVDAAAVLAAQLDDAVTICSLSNFNQYWILQALGNAGALDRAVASIERCWGVEIALGGTSFWEISHPDWAISLRPGHPMPYGENGQTSLCHPWSAGPAPWLSKFVLGVAPGATGGAVVVTPHVTAEMARGGGVAGAVPTPRGPVEVDVRTPSGGGGGGGGGSVHVAAPVAIELVLSEVLLRRVGWLAAPLGDGPLVVVRVDGGPKMELVADGGAGAGPRGGGGGAAARGSRGCSSGPGRTWSSATPRACLRLRWLRS